MAHVYRGWHLILNQPVALKVLRGEFVDHAEAVERFLREAQALAALNGIHIARVMDVATTDEGLPFMVLELLKGQDLQQLLARGPLAVSRAVEFVMQAADGIAEAHARGLVHRDIKPSNLFLCEQGDGSELLKVIDFGISKSLSHSGRFKTASRDYLGSPQYMSPEQVRSPREVDQRTDVWSLGVVLYELLTGMPPFEGSTLPAVCSSVLTATPVPVRRLRSEVSEQLEHVIMTCLRKEPGERYQSAAELGQALAALRSDISRSAVRALGGTTEAQPEASLTISQPGVVARQSAERQPQVAGCRDAPESAESGVQPVVHLALPDDEPVASGWVRRVPRGLLYGGGMCAAAFGVVWAWPLLEPAVTDSPVAVSHSASHIIELATSLPEHVDAGATSRRQMHMHDEAEGDGEPEAAVAVVPVAEPLPEEAESEEAEHTDSEPSREKARPAPRGRARVWAPRRRSTPKKKASDDQQIEDRYALTYEPAPAEERSEKQAVISEPVREATALGF